MIGFIDDHRKAYGVEPICRVLPIAHRHTLSMPSAAIPERMSVRAQRDDVLKVEVKRVFDQNFGVYGVRKVWRQLVREGVTIARCPVERLMRKMGPRGISD